MSEEQRRIFRECEKTLKLVSELERKMDSFILKRRFETLEIRREALLGNKNE